MHAIVATFILALAPAPWDTGESRPEDLEVSLVTVGPGTPIQEWWGHTALVVADKRLGETRLYNYGVFSFSQGFVRNFVFGRLWFLVADVRGTEATYSFYKHVLNRDIRIQVLNFTPKEAMRAAQLLAWQVRPENATYLYQHYTDNCSTRPRDVIDQALGGALARAALQPSATSFRKLAARFTQVDPPGALLLDYLQGASIDVAISKYDEAYLPDELEAQVDALTLPLPDGGTRSLVKRKWVEFKSGRPTPASAPPNWNAQLFLLGVGVALVTFVVTRARALAVLRIPVGLSMALYGLVGGSLGTVNLFMRNFTDHHITQNNENIFLLSPLQLLLVPFGIALAVKSRRSLGAVTAVACAMAAFTLLELMFKASGAFHQDNWNLLALFVPINLGAGYSLWKTWRWSPR